MRKSTISLLSIAFFSCAGTSPDPMRMAANLADYREIRDSASPPVQRIIARNKIAIEQGASVTQVALENGIPIGQLVMETYVVPASRPATPR